MRQVFRTLVYLITGAAMMIATACTAKNGSGDPTASGASSIQTLDPPVFPTKANGDTDPASICSVLSPGELEQILGGPVTANPNTFGCDFKVGNDTFGVTVGDTNTMIEAAKLFKNNKDTTIAGNPAKINTGFGKIIVSRSKDPKGLGEMQISYPFLPSFLDDDAPDPLPRATALLERIVPHYPPA